MSEKIKLRETMWAEMSPDLYGGDECDQLEPRWETYADGDKQGGFDDMISLTPGLFPPGTRVVISEPECPICNDVRSVRLDMNNQTIGFDEKCDCGFDWAGWTEAEYS